MGCDGAVVGSWERRMGVRERERRADWCDEVSTPFRILATYLSFLFDYINCERGH